MKKQLKDIMPVARLLKDAERTALSLTSASLSRALRRARVQKVVPFSVRRTGRYPAHDEAQGFALRVSLGRGSGWVVLYDLTQEWGSADYNHVEYGIAVLDRGKWTVLAYEGQHAGQDEFATGFWSVAELIQRELDPFRVAELPFGDLGGDWRPKFRYEQPDLRRLRRPRGRH